MDTEEKLAACAAFKANGNAKFKAGKNALAIKKYKAALEIVKSEDSLSVEQKKLAQGLKRSCNLNLAAAALKLKDYKEALDAASQVSRRCGNSLLSLHVGREPSLSPAQWPCLSAFSLHRCLRRTPPW